MAEALTIEQMINGSIDVDTIEQAALEDMIVTARNGREFPSAPRAVRLILEQGTIDATLFKTKVDLDSGNALGSETPVSLIDDDFALVFNDDDVDLNGYYQKQAGVWEYLPYNIQRQALNQIENAKQDAIGTATADATEKADAALVSAKAYADANPIFKPVVLTANIQLSTLAEGTYYILDPAVGNSIPDMPTLSSSIKVGTVIVKKEKGNAYQKFYHYNTLEQLERVGNGASSNLQYSSWTKVIKQSDLDSNTTVLSAALASKPDLNLFKNVNLTSADAFIYQATVADESGYPTLTMSTTTLSSVFYDSTLDDKYFKVGATLVFNTQVFSDGVGTSGADITIQALSSTGSTLATSVTTRNTKVNTWETISTSLVLPSGTAKVRTRFIRREGNTVVKFRNPILSSNTIYGRMILPSGSSASTSTNSIVYVAKTGSDTNLGSMTEPFLTLQKAINSVASTGGEVRVLDDGEYRDSLTIDSPHNIKISASYNKRVNIFGSDKLVVTKTTGFTKVYQAPLAVKPVGMGGNRGKPAIFEWGTKSKPIIEAERHYLHHGLTHRLPFTEMNEVTTKAELDTVGGNGKWFWESGVIYLSATDGGDASAKRYEARARPVITHTNGTIELVRVTSWFSSGQAMDLKGIKTSRLDCIAYGAYKDGFSDNANTGSSHRDIAGGNGNDGFNCTVTTYANNAEINDRISHIYFDPYGHDNGDDGLSCHYRADSTVYGGLFEYNTKADVVHVTGANCVCFDTVSRGTNYGFYAASAPDGDPERVAGHFKCVNTRAVDNNYSYMAAADGVLECQNTTAVNPAIMGYNQSGAGVLYANDCKFIGDSAKAKAGNVIVTNSDILTP